MDLPLASADLLLRGAAAALLLFHVAHVLGSRLPRLQRFALAAFLASVLAYLICSRPDFSAFHWAVKVPAMVVCLMSAPLLWLAMQVIFDDDFGWSARVGGLLALALALGLLAAAGMGGLPVGIGHKMLLLGIALATLWTILKDWRSDLVSSRRMLRMGVAGGVGAYVFMVLAFEMAFAAASPPRWLEVLNLAGIVCLTGLLAVITARHPLHEWLCSVGPSLALPMPAVAPDTSHGAIPVTANRPMQATQDLTAPPPALDRKAALRERLVRSMGSQRAYAREGLSLAQLAAQLETTPAQLREVINQNLGYRNFNDFLHHYRVDEAAQRLVSQDLPILSIALDVGYGSIGPFNRAFKHIKGATPSEFRAQNR